MTASPIIIVSGALANKPWNGGEAWVRLSWILGLRRLGYQVYFVEQIAAGACVDHKANAVSFEASTNLAFFRHVTRTFGLNASLICGDGQLFEGLSREQLLNAADEAELLVNISGHLDWPPLFDRIRCKAYIDIDPGYTQFWHEQGNTGARLRGHDLYFTIAENIGRDDCTIPTCGLEWLPIRQPVVLDEWPVCETPSADPRSVRFTTVASWRGSFGPVTAAGRTFGSKAHEFRKVLPLPQRVAGGTFEIALAIHRGDEPDLQALCAHGWRITAPANVAADPDAFRRYVQDSAAEFSVAQGIYVETHSGWVSDRTIRYLASGLPALVQNTGLASNYPCGRGLVTFDNLDGAADAAEQIACDYAMHARAARAVAEEYFDSDRVLSGFLKRVSLPCVPVMT